MRDDPLKTPWRHRLRLNVRALMILVLMLGGWLGWITHHARVQHDAVAAIVRSGGFVLYDGAMWVPGESERAGFLRPRWLVDLVGIDYFSRVTELSLVGRATDADLLHIGCLDQLDRLSVSSSRITDAGLRHLRRLKNLQTLYLHYTPITDKGLAHLNGLPRLELLSLSGTEVTDASIPTLQSLTNLRWLDVPDGVSDAGMEDLKKALPKSSITHGFPCKQK